MTQNQILYQQHLEQKRANQRNEQLTEARDIETARANKVKEVETERSNRAKEAENYRSHSATEAEAYRSNTAREQELKRSNLAKEMENYRSNRAGESLQHEANQLGYAGRIDSANISAGASNYGSDRRYQGQVDSAYINKHGVSPTTVKNVVNAGTKLATSFAKTKPGVVLSALAINPMLPFQVGVKSVKDKASELAQSIQNTLKKGSTNYGKQKQSQTRSR